MYIGYIQPLNLTILIDLHQLIPLARDHIAHGRVIAPRIINHTVGFAFVLLPDLGLGIADHPQHHFVLNTAVLADAHLGLARTEQS